MSDAAPPPGRVPAQWRKQAGAKGRERGSGRLLKLVLLGAALAVVGGLIAWLVLTGPPAAPAPVVVRSAVVGQYADLIEDGVVRAALAPTPWFVNDAEQLRGVPRVTHGDAKNWTIVQTRDSVLAGLKADLKVGQAKADVQATKPGEEVIAVIYLAAVGASRDGVPYFVTNDWYLDAGKNGIKLEEIVEQFEKSPLKNKLLLLNWSPPRAVNPAGPAAEVKSPTDGGRFAADLHTWLEQREKAGKLPCVVITACSAGEDSLPLAVEARSVFGYYLALGLQGRAARVNGDPTPDITVNQLARYLELEVDRWAQENTGRRQRPRRYKAGEDFVLVRNVPPEETAEPPVEPQPTQPGPNAGDKPPTKEAEEAERVKKAKEEAKRRAAVEVALGGAERFRAWEDGWVKCFEWGYRFDPTAPEVHTAGDLALAQRATRRLAAALRRYEEVLLQYHGKTGRGYPGDAMVGPWRDKFEAEYAADVKLLGEAGELSIKRDRSLAALWFGWDPEATRESLTKYRDLQKKLREALTPPPPAPPAPDKPIDPAKLAELIKAEGKTSQRELVALGWKGLTEEGELTKDRVNLLRSLILQLLPEDRKHRELVIVQRLSDYLANPGFEPAERGYGLALRTMRLWLQIEHRDEQIVQLLLPAVRHFEKRRVELEELRKRYDAEVARLIKMSKPGKPLEILGGEIERTMLPALTTLLADYQKLTDLVTWERALHEAWDEAIGQIHATASLALVEDDESFARWKAWTEAAAVLAPLAKDGAPPLSPGELDRVRRPLEQLRAARQQYFARSQGGAAVGALFQVVDKQLAEGAITTESVQALERLREAEFLSAPDRLRLMALLVTSRQRLHERTRHSTGRPRESGGPLTTSLGPDEQRRQDVAEALRKLPAPADSATLLARRRQDQRAVFDWLAKRHLDLLEKRSEIDGAKEYHQTTAEYYKTEANQLGRPPS